VCFSNTLFLNGKIEKNTLQKETIVIKGGKIV
jgi:hypothetical protein